MRGAILSIAVLIVASAAPPAQAVTPVNHGLRPPMPPPVRSAFTPRPITSRPIATRPVSIARPPHCPNPPPPKPISVKIPKVPSHHKRTMALIQQNIIMMQAMRAAEAPRRCDPSWSARKLLRRGCPPAQFAPEPVLEPASPLPPLAPGATIATAQDAAGGQN